MASAIVNSEPFIERSELTGRWYFVQSWRPLPHGGREAHIKHDITDALQAHDRQVAAKALTEAAGRVYEEWPGGTGEEGLGVEYAENWLNARAADLVSERSTLGNGYVSNSKPWWAEPSTPEHLGHEFVGVAHRPDDDKCTFRADGTDLTYCGETKAEHGPSTPEQEEDRG